MRKLTVHRKKQIVAAAMKIRICINTLEPGDFHLKDANLKELGLLKNGGSLTVDIPEEAVDVYVVFDKHFPQRFHHRFSLPAGSEPVVLYTRSRLNPLQGNPFTLSDK
jgi:hypothetical protein